MKILVTGADGFIGSHLTEALVKSGYDVRAFVKYNSMNSRGWLDHCSEDIIKELEVFPGDIRDCGAIRSAIKGCDKVFHLAALVAIPYSYLAPLSYIETNVTGTLNVVEAARDLNISKVILTSTSEVYGTARFVPITEDHPLQAQSPYSASKIAADQIGLSFNKSFGTPISIIRPFNTYGPRQSARAIIPTLITQIASKRAPVKLGAVHPTRDFSFIDDTVQGFLSIMDCADAIGTVTNIGCGFEISIFKTAQMIAKLMNSSVEFVADAQRFRPKQSEVERLLASNQRAKQIMGWVPEYGGVNGLTLGLKKTIDWFQDPENIKKYKVHEYAI